MLSWIAWVLLSTVTEHLIYLQFHESAAFGLENELREKQAVMKGNEPLSETQPSENLQNFRVTA